jgi:hypothetical protein
MDGPILQTIPSHRPALAVTPSSMAGQDNEPWVDCVMVDCGLAADELNRLVDSIITTNPNDKSFGTGVLRFSRLGMRCHVGHKLGPASNVSSDFFRKA